MNRGKDQGDSQGAVMVTLARLEERMISVQEDIRDIKEHGTRTCQGNNTEIEKLKAQVNFRTGVGGGLIALFALLEQAWERLAS